MGFEKILHWHGYQIYPQEGQFVDWYLNKNGHAGFQNINNTQSAVDAAFDAWENVTTANIRFVYKDTTSNTWSGSDNKNVHYWAPEGDAAYDSLFLGGYIAVTAITYNNTTGHLIDADVVYNNRDYVWGLSDNWPTWLDIQAEATHENGHLIGIAHSEFSGKVMTQGYAGESKRYLQFDDEIAVSFLYGGKLIDDEVFHGDVSYSYPNDPQIQEDFYVPWSLTVTSGHTLTIEPGTTIRIKGQSTTISTEEDAIIEAFGTLEEGILFTSETASAATSWNLIRLLGDDNCFDYCTFEYARWPLYFNDSENNWLEDCTMQHNERYGVMIDNSEVNIIGCNIDNNDYYGIYMKSNADVFVDDSQITNNTKHGIYSFSNAYLKVNNSLVSYNGTQGSSFDGINFKGTAALCLANNNNYGQNTIRNNYRYGVYANYSSPVVQFIGNSILNNSSYEIYNVAGNPTINAVSSWWGSYPPAAGLNYGSVTITTPLTSAPAWILKGVIPDNSLKTISESIVDYQNSPSFTKCDAAANEDLISFYGQCRSVYRKAVKQKKNDFYTLLSGIYKENKNNAKGVLALRYMVNCRSMENDAAGAISLGKELLSLKDIKSDEKNRIIYNDILSELAFIYCKRGDLANAEKYALEFKQNSDDAEMLELVNLEIEETKRLLENGEIKYIQPEADSPAVQDTLSESGSAMAANYPNPSNAATTIRYSIEEPGMVTIRIYNVLGEQVCNLLQCRQEAGKQHIIWNGKNDTGLDVPSGIYFYVIKTNTKQFVNKMTMVR